MTRTRARSQRRAGLLRQGAPKPRQEHHACGQHDPFGEGATDASAAFETYDVGHFLAPNSSLKEGQIVVRDRLGAHRGERVRGLIEEKGAVLWFLPSSYSRRTSAL
jgi:hypothetical protein